ncbi:MAG: T9SS type A sorting domain-containing protein [Bacteroidales bacterium]|nr:T9SS type A sorting domain-containing protein [Bacteroidales bacterium]
MKKQLSTWIILTVILISGNLMAQNFALDLDGADDKVGVLDSPELNPQNALTIEAWINAEEWQSSIWAGVIVGKQGTNPDKGYCLTAGENGRVEFTVAIEEGWKSVSTPQILGTNAWYHIAAVYDGSQVMLYINGILQNTEDAEGELTLGSGVVMNIGDNPTWPGRFWNGKLDEIRIWDIARDEAEIQSTMSIELSGTESGLVAYFPMNEGSGTTTSDVSGNNNEGQLINMTEDVWVAGFEPVTADVGVIGIASPSIVGSGFTSSEKIKIDLKNFATEAVSGFEVSYRIGDDDAITETVNVEIGPFETYIHTFNGTVDLSGIDEIELTGFTTLEGDNNTENDVLTETINPTTNLMIFDQERHNYGGYGQTHTMPVYMPENLNDFSDILLHIDLECPTGGCDPWDQPAKVMIIKDGENYELARYITPYGKACGGWTWNLTDFRSLLIDKVDWVSYVQVWGASGWLVSIELELIEGTPEYPFVKIEKLWAEDNWVYGDPDINDDFPEMTVNVHSLTEAAKIRMTMTGHGQANTDNAAEFSNFTHHVKVNGEQAFTQNLWNDDCDQNECSNQAGTWLYSRAGWCPGQDVQPWEWNMDGLYTPGQDVNIDFVLQDYTNLLNSGYNGGSHTEPHYRCHTYFVQYSHENIVDVAKNNKQEETFRIYPNPSTALFTVKSINNESIESISIFQSNGIMVNQFQSVRNDNLQLDLGAFPNGIYLVKVQTATSSSVIKVIKSN